MTAQAVRSHFRPAPPGQTRARLWRLAAAAALAVLVLLALAAGASAFSGAARFRSTFEAELVRVQPPAGVLDFYRSRSHQPLWVDDSGRWPWSRAVLRPEAARLIAEIDRAPESARPPPEGRRLLAELMASAARGRPADLARAEAALSTAFVGWVTALRRASDAVELAFVDPALQPPSGARPLLEQAAAAPSLMDHLAAVGEVNPIYRALREGHAVYRAEWSGLPQVQVPAGPPLAFGVTGERVRLLRQRLGVATGDPTRFDEPLERAVRRFQEAHGLEPTGRADAATVEALNLGYAHFERLILANLERARALPPLTGRRYLVVNVPAGELGFHEAGQARQSMKVAVGAAHDQTPMMVGLMRYLVFNPYWNVPVDMVQHSIAPRVLAGGPGYFQAQRMQALSDWSAQAQELDPRQIDWAGVAAGHFDLRVRQRPGADNMMGDVKFMLPNELGIYLHDTPDKSVFRAQRRLISAGCVRLERAHDLADWLLGHRRPQAAWLGPDHRIDLDEPVPVYITYLTAAPTIGGAPGITFHPDVYGRDPALLAALG